MNLIERYIESNAFGRLIGMDWTIISPGNIEYRLKVGPQHLATPHAAHGGLIGALVDGALGTAGLSLVHEEHKAVSTIEYKLNFISPALLNDELIAYGKVESRGKRILVISCDVFAVNRNKHLIAKALGTFNAYDASKAGL